MDEYINNIQNNSSRNEINRKKIISDFIINNQGCSKEALVKGTSNYISRKTVYKLLEELEKNNIIRIEKDKPNSRDHKLFVDSENPFILIPLELEEFEAKFFNFINKYLNNIEEIKKYSVLKKYKNIINYLKNFPISLLNSIFQFYIIRLMELQIHIRKSDIPKLFSILFERLSQIYSSFTILATQPNNIDYLHTFRRDYKLKDILKARYYNKEIYSPSLLYVNEILEYLNICSAFGLKKEIEEVIDSLWKINKDIQKFIYIEPIIFNWNYNFGIDDWRKLVQYQKENPNQKIYRSQKEQEWEKIENDFREFDKRLDEVKKSMGLKD
jgi:hypothetical protein